MGKNICYLYIRKRTDNQGAQKLYSPKLNEPIKKWATEPIELFQRKTSKWSRNT
jgi:hypothetical protein